jgi:hypothetical protein
MDQELKQYLDGKFTEQDAKFARDLERVETALLTEFHKWASPAEARTRSHTAALRALELDVESLTERVQKLENRA